MTKIIIFNFDDTSNEPQDAVQSVDRKGALVECFYRVSTFMLKSTLGAEWVNAPREMKSTPLFAT